MATSTLATWGGSRPGAGRPPKERTFAELTPRFSFLRAIQQLVTGKELDGLEGEVSQELDRERRAMPNHGYFSVGGKGDSALVPLEAFNLRQVVAGGPSALVGPRDLQPTESSLLSWSVVHQAGAEILTNLQ